MRVAYATAGQGPALLVPAAWIGHLEVAWQDPAVRAFFGPLAAHRTVVRYDKPDCGLSDPWPGRQTLETDLQVLQAVADHLRLDRFDLLGISMAAPASAAFAARHPGRVGHLILYGGYADGHRIASADVATAMVDLVRAHWGLGSDVLADVFLPYAGAEAKAQFARLQRDSAPAGVAADLLAQCYQTEVDPLPARPRPGRPHPGRAAGVAGRPQPPAVRRRHGGGGPRHPRLPRPASRPASSPPGSSRSPPGGPGAPRRLRYQVEVPAGVVSRLTGDPSHVILALHS